MPLSKKAPETNGGTATAAPLDTTGTKADASMATPPKKLGGTRKAGDKPEAAMTKDDYWRRREERDIEKDHRISRQGMFQAALQSVGVLQLNASNTLDGYMELVEKVAERGLQFANK